MEVFVAPQQARLRDFQAAIAAQDEFKPGFGHTDEPWPELVDPAAELRKRLAPEIVQHMGTSTGIDLRTCRGKFEAAAVLLWVHLLTAGCRIRS